MSKKLILQLDFYDEKIKQKCMQKVCGLPGIESVAVNSKEKKLTVIGEVDPVRLVHKLRKLCRTDIVSIGPAKEPEKKKDDGKKDEGKKDDGKKGGDDKKAGSGDEKKPGNGGGGGGGGDGKKGGGDGVKVFPALHPPPGYPQVQYHHPQYPPHYPPMYQQFPSQRYPAPAPAYFHRGAEEDPNSCVIC